MQSPHIFKHGFQFKDLLSSQGLQRLDRQYLSFLQENHPELEQKLECYRQSDKTYSPLELSDLLIALAPSLELFLVGFFSIEEEYSALKKRLSQETIVQKFKKYFVLRRGRRYRGEIKKTFSEISTWLDNYLSEKGIKLTDRESAVAQLAIEWLDDKEKYAQEIEQLTQWCVLGLKDSEGKKYTKSWQSFRLPQGVDPNKLVELVPISNDPVGRLQADPSKMRQRYGFALTDTRANLRQSENQIHYCIYCHDHDGDFCSKGFPEKKAKPELGFKKSALGEFLTGCPLEEKISEMHYLRRRGLSIAALAVAMVDNPMIPATGHRICNDCMKACIYQKQDPVDIPQTETRILTDVLNLPWGVEIYDLLSKWNPLRQSGYCINDYCGYNVLIAGMGPAGFTMAHYLTMSGCGVVGIDGLKIEPLPSQWLQAPIKSYAQIKESLDERILLGFGGVAEYGITVRWDKNFLKLIYLSLARRSRFQVFGGVRFGGTIKIEDAWRLGFDHISIANGAGYPRVLNIKNSMCRGIRQASDFLMALQLTGAAKSSSLANLQVRLPAVVVGSGLTAIDTATEVQAYYIKQIEKIDHRYQILKKELGEDEILKPLDEENQKTLKEYLNHAEELQDERKQAHKQGRNVDYIKLLRRWGGVTVAYRRRMIDSPAYRRNHEEINKAMEEGIYYLESMEPTSAKLDKYKHIEALECINTSATKPSKGKVTIPARAVFIATGANPNTIYGNEYPGQMQLQQDHYEPYINRPRFSPAPPALHNKAENYGAFTSYNQDHHKISFIGDAHPVFHGSVVKAIASAKRSSVEIMDLLTQSKPSPRTQDQYQDFNNQIRQLLSPKVHSIKQHDNLVEILVQAPLAAENFKAGQFFRMQTYESMSPIVCDTRLQLPLQTVSGAGVDGDKMRLLLLRFGANARLAERLKPGDPIVLMGPTGKPAHMPANKTILVIAGSWGAAVMLHLGPALRANGNRILYISAYRDQKELYFKQELENAADQMIWVCSNNPKIKIDRKQDKSFVEKNIIKLMQHDALNITTSEQISLSEVDEVLVMGSTGLLVALQQAFKQELKPLFADKVKVIGTVGSPMQCMLKGVCAQCLQWQIDPDTGERTMAVFTCAMQDQELACIDLDNLSARQNQNRLSEYISGLWVNHVLNGLEH